MRSHTSYLAGMILGVLAGPTALCRLLHRKIFKKASLLAPTVDRPFLAYVHEQSIIPQGLHLKGEIGAGCGGRVYEGDWKGAKVAVKQLWHQPAGFVSNVYASQEALYSLASAHPNVVATYRVYTLPASELAKLPPPSTSVQPFWPSVVTVPQSSSDGDTESTASSYCLTTFLVMEYCEGGTLNDRLSTLWALQGSDSQEGMRCVLKCLVEIVVGLEYLHSIGIVHGDLTCCNVLCQTSIADSRGYRCLISDFGLSRFVRVGYEGYTTRPGAVIFAAPEKMLTGRLSPKSDIYSYGMSAWNLISMDASLPAGAQDMYEESLYTWRPEFPVGTPVALQRLISTCWSYQHIDRPSCDDIRRQVTEQLQNLP